MLLSLVSYLGFLLSTTITDPKETLGKKEFQALQGAWKLSSVEIDGKLEESLDDFPRWIIQGDQVQYGGKTWAKLIIDLNTTPKSLDLSFAKPKRVYEAIYMIEADTLKICLNRQTEGVKERPTDFKTEGKADLRLFTFQRDTTEVGTGIEGAGFVGIAIQVNEKTKQVQVLNTLSGSPAEKAGLKKDDIVLKVGNQEAKDLPSVVRMIRQAKAGQELILRIQREGKEQEITIQAGLLPFFFLDG